GLSRGTMPTSDVMGASAKRPASAARKTPSAPHASAGDTAPLSPASATLSGDGVSPAARAAASGSPPGSAAATARADGGRRAGSGSRQRRRTRSTIGSNPSMNDEGDEGVASDVGETNAFFPVNSS